MTYMTHHTMVWPIVFHTADVRGPLTYTLSSGENGLVILPMEVMCCPLCLCPDVGAGGDTGPSLFS